MCEKGPTGHPGDSWTKGLRPGRIRKLNKYYKRMRRRRRKYDSDIIEVSILPDSDGIFKIIKNV